MFPKGNGMQNMLKQAQKMQEKMLAAQNELDTLTVEGQAGGGMVTVVATGKKEIVSIRIEPEVLEEDVEMVEDLIVAAVNQALASAGEAAEEKLSAVTGGMLGNLKIPGM